MNRAKSYLSAIQSLQTKGYCILRDSDLGFSQNDRALINAFYNETVLQNDLPNVYPVDRLRARDVVRYRWQEKKVFIAEHSSIKIKTPKETLGNHPHEVVREYKRTFILDESAFRRIIEHLLQMIPPEERQSQGTIGVNLFKTFSDVVSGPHQDGVQFVGIYIPDRNCAGSETTLASINKPDETIFNRSLEIGDFLIFRDKDFIHSVSPLKPPTRNNGSMFRNALILTVDYKSSYQA